MCKVFNVELAILSRHLAAFKKSETGSFQYVGNCDVNRVFDDVEEKSIVEYIKNVAKMQYGLSKKGVRELA